MKKFTFISGAFTTIALISSCIVAPVVDPPPPQPDPCEVYHTGCVSFENKSNSNTTYTIIWDGSALVTLAPGEKSSQYTVAAGSHTMLFKVSNSGYSACNEANPSIAPCSSLVFSCSH